MIPYNKPFIVGKELFNISRAVIEYKQLSGDGVYTKKCHEWLQKMTGCHKALLTHSCTAALEMAAILCDIQPGDEVIMPSFTFVSTANAFVLRGGVPVFIDIRPDTLNIDEKLIEAAITDRTKAVVPVHYAGIPCEMDIICEIARRRHLFVVEDAAQALFSKYEDQHLGTIGDIGTLSFHETKNIISGEGGAILLNSERFVERAEILWEKGTDRKKFSRGIVDKYTWVDIGSSYLPGEIIAAFLHAQFEMGQMIVEKRQRIFNKYIELLTPLSQQNRIGLPWQNKTDTSNGHIFYILTASEKERSYLIEYLQDRDINALFHYVPLHSSPAGRKFGRAYGNLQHTMDLSGRVLRLPLFYAMQDDEILRVTDEIKMFYSSR